jgi:hypothetical protein
VKKLSIALVLLLAACSADLTLPPEIDGIVPPAPENFTVTTTDHITYDLSWTISDPTVIRFYRLYYVAGGPPVLADTSAATSVQVTTNIPFIVFGVTSVSTDDIEGPAVFATAE